MYSNVLGLIFSLLVLLPTASFSLTSSLTWLEVDIGIIGTASDDILEDAIEEVKENGYGGLFIKMDTPGGSLEATRSMVKNIMKAPFPVVIWVGPDGARAGSAGAFITLSAHIAAMAPGTNIGAAHPVQAGGKDIEKGDIGKKIENDTVAFMESIAESRNRNIEMAVSFVVNSLSVTAKEALENKVIDLVASSRAELFEKIDGKEVKLQNGSIINLKTSSVNFEYFEKSLRQKFLEIISNPNLFYLLFVAGLIGIGFELTHPGSLIPGVVGGISMILALIATSVLPVSFGAMILIVVSIAFMVAEIFIPSFGILGIGGFIAFIIGSVLLVDPNNEQGLRISWTTIAPGALAVASFGLLVAYLVLKTERSVVQSGREGMIGMEGVVISPFVNGKGKVRIGGEIWSASASDGDDLKIDEVVKVCDINGLELFVKAGDDSIKDV